MASELNSAVLPGELLAILRDIAAVGGRGILVGGFVRDQLLGLPSKDFDVEVYKLTIDDLQRCLKKHGPVVTVGRSFGVLLYKPLDIDFSLPRHDSKAGSGHRGFVVDTNPELNFAEAARRRDLTLNSIGWDPLNGELLDPHDGISDLRAGILKATDPKHFGEDPLRALRVMQFSARLGMKVDPSLVKLCAAQDLSELSAERIRDEFLKLLLKSQRPSIGFEFLKKAGLLHFFPALAALIDTPQDPQWHPEGDVWTHTLMVLDEAAKLRDDGDDGDEGDDDMPLMWGALCHDFGKPVSTMIDEKGRVRSGQHEQKGIEPAREFLMGLKLPQRLVQQVLGLVRYHLMPAWLRKQKAPDKAYRRLSRRLAKEHISPNLLAKLATADHLGRTTPQALARSNDDVDEFTRRMSELGLNRPLEDVVLGRHLLARGVKAGPHMKTLLDQCREVQDEWGWTDPDQILDRVLADMRKD